MGIEPGCLERYIHACGRVRGYSGDLMGYIYICHQQQQQQQQQQQHDVCISLRMGD